MNIKEFNHIEKLVEKSGCPPHLLAGATMAILKECKKQDCDPMEAKFEDGVLILAEEDENKLVSNCCSANVENGICQDCFDGCEEIKTI